MLPPVAPVVVIHDDPGGIVEDFAARVADYRRHHVRVVVRGECASACTMVLALADRVCAGPGASFGFHQAFTPLPGNFYATWNRSESATAELMRHYPRPVTSWINRHGGLTSELIWLKGDELRSIVPACRKGSDAEGGAIR